MDKLTHQVIYFLECGSYIKIGRTAFHQAKARLLTLQTGNPFPILPLGYIDANLKSEKDLHKLFAPFHHRGEWFFAIPAIHSFVLDYAEPWNTLPNP